MFLAGINWLEIASTVYRTIVIYLILLLVMRIMGKREVGKLSPFDFVVAIVIAELAALPMDKEEMSLVHGMAPIFTLVGAEIFLSWLSLKSTWVRRFINGTPSVLVENGRLVEEEMRRNRYNVNDLLAQLREKGYANVADVEFAILETSGQLSVIPKAERRPVTPADLGLKVSAEGLPVILVIDGQLQERNLARIGWNRKKAEEVLRRKGVTDIKKVLLATVDSRGEVYVSERRAK